MGAVLGRPPAWRRMLMRAVRHCRSGLSTVAAALVYLACALPLHAQSLPDAGSIQRDIERQQQARPPAPAPQTVPAAPAVEPRQDELQFQVRAFVLKGVTLISETEVQHVLEPWRSRPIQFSDLEKAKQVISDLYQRQGWFARPQIPEQELQDNGDLTINVIEGRLGAIRIENESDDKTHAQRIDRVRIQQTFTARQQVGEPLYTPHIERAISLLNDIPGMGVSANLISGETPGASDVVVSPLIKSLVSGTLTRDNAGSRSTGAVKDTLSLNVDNPAALGDQFGLSLMRSKGVNYSRLGYSLPVGYDGVRLSLNVSEMRYQVIFPMGPSNPSYPRGAAYTQGLSLSWPVLRSASNNIYLSTGLDRKHFVNEIFNPDTHNVQALSNKRVGVGNLSLNGDHSDAWGEGGMTQWSLGWGRGHIDLSANLQNQQQDQQGPQTQGRFEKLSYGLSRLQRLSGAQSLWLSLQGQQASKNLDSSEKFTLGGSQGVRAFPSAEASGDHGRVFTVESRQVLTPQWQWVVFYDHGKITVNDQTYVGVNGPVQVSLRGWGTGLTWNLPGRLLARMTWARRHGENPLANVKTGLDSDGTLVRERVWLSLTALF